MSGDEMACEHPQQWEAGDVAMDAEGHVGRVMDVRVGTAFLRPLNGGVEWSAPVEELEPAAQSDALSAAVDAANTRTRERGRL
ncbi:hypothetical protein [Streptomyces purpureus]|uniref:Uncharacterized protein n=1 Tax=Streptomyces purpureus TaxID=1951 RepID=A0A918H4V8_9ACTN|nr:hypothetical protein [Streptomyces purpureus]GGT36559.1 hypothetical protein GCM10014713_32850 [Streptomyces purpureus]